MGSLTIPSINFLSMLPVYLGERRKLKNYIQTVFKKEKVSLKSLNIIFCNDEFLLGINQQFLGHDYYTDIISFNLADKDQPVEGEIYISIDRVRENALQAKDPFKLELQRVIFHGLLHLCGYKDKKPPEKELMRKMEDRLLNQFSKL